MDAPSAIASVFQAQISALEKAALAISPHANAAIELLLSCKGKVVVTGIGKSGHIAHKISATLASTGTPSVYLNANEALHGDLGLLSNGDVVLMLSKSGTTPELIRILPKIKSLGIRTLGIFGNLNTPLAEKLDLVLDGSVPAEGSPFNLAPMSSTTVALVIGDALAAALMLRKGLKEADFASNHPAGQLGKNLLLKASDVMHQGEALPLIAPNQTIREAILMLTRKNLGGVCVVQPDLTLAGFLTDGDIRKYLSKADDLSVPVSEIMTIEPRFLEPDMGLGQVLAMMEVPGRQIYVAPVLQLPDRKVLGILRMHDILSNG
jgi:arabinose-5-phosphate isomerase